MPSIPIPLGGRLPLLDHHTLTAQQQSLFDEVAYTVIPWADASSLLAQDSEGRFIGPFNPALLHLELARALSNFSSPKASTPCSASASAR